MKRAIVLALLVGCGGTEALEPSGEESHGGETGPSWSERATQAWGEADLERAGFASDNALRLDDRDEVAKEVAAKVALATHRPDRVLAILEGATSPVLVRLRVRAHLSRLDYASAARELASIAEAEPRDPWSDAVLPLARAGSGHDLYRAEGPERAQVAFEDAPLPLVTISIDGTPVKALIATSVDFVVIDDERSAEPTLVASLAVGDVIVHDVPALSRDLADISGPLGADVQAVIGLDFLERMRATIHGRDRWLSVRTSGTDATSDAHSVPFYTLGGGLAAVHARVREDVAGFFTIDSAGLFPVAVADSLLTAMGVDEATLEPAPGAPSESIRMLTLAQIEMGGVGLEEVPAVTGLLPPDLDEKVGAPISGTLGGLLLSAMMISFDPEDHELMIE